MDTKKHTAATVSRPQVTGKKRKKKKFKGEKDSEHSKDISKPVLKQEAVPLASAITVTKIEAVQCSSSSSIESHKPMMKSARFEDNSSDGISKEDISLNVASNEPLESRSPNTTGKNNKPSLSEKMSFSSSSPSPPHAPCYSQSNVTSVGGGNNSVPAAVNELKALASLRWVNALSDEEKEEKRIEEYKQDRRERYQKDLLAKKEQSRSHKTTQHAYYSMTTVK